MRTPDDPAAHGRDPFFWGAYVMAPWCNRVQPGPVEVAGSTVDLAPNYGDGSAIHGQVSGRAWELDGDGWLRVTGGGDGWPWAYEVGLQPTLDRRTLTLACTLTNRSGAPMPAGIGLHPWFRRPLEVRVPADWVYRVNTDSPARAEPVSGAFDLRSRGGPAPGLDATWSAVAPPAIELGWPDDGIRATIEASTSGSLLVAVATPPEIDAIAVEPQTHGPDGLRRLRRGEPDALRLLPPGASMGLVLRLTVDREAAYR
ncbi:MAG: hypothetical protein H0W10_01520 [Chloroflexi bacterium]|nr:hypothetical protein [Chloroflexota bacterium]